MSTNDPSFNGHAEPVRQDYTVSIARPGEQQFACILRNRSGFDAGNIDYGARDVTALHPSEQQDVVDAAYSLYVLFCMQTDKRAQLDPCPKVRP